MIGRTNVGGGKPEEEKTVTAGTSAIEVNPSSGKVLKKVVVNPTPTESKTVTAGTSAKVVTPSSGKHLNRVTVTPTPSQAKTVAPIKGTQIVKPDSGKLLSQVTVGSSPTFDYLNPKVQAVISNLTDVLTVTFGEYPSKGRYNKKLNRTLLVNDKNKMYTTVGTSGTSWNCVPQNYNQIGALKAVDVSEDGAYAVMAADNQGSKTKGFMTIQSFSAYCSSTGVFNYAYLPDGTKCKFNDIVCIGGRKFVAVGLYDTYGEISIVDGDASGFTPSKFNEYVSLYEFITDEFIRCCKVTTSGGEVFVPVVDVNGKMGLVASIIESFTYYNTKEIDTDFTAKICEQLGDYLVVAGTKSDGTYIYYINADDVEDFWKTGNSKWKGFKITDTVHASFYGLAYVNGLYALMYGNKPDSVVGSRYVWLSTDLASGADASGLPIVDGVWGEVMIGTETTLQVFGGTKKWRNITIPS